MNIGVETLPEYMQGAIRRYIEHGIPPGGFLKAVFENDLVQSAACADEINKRRLYDYASFLYAYAPSGCWGSPQIVERWIEIGGLEGLIRLKEKPHEALSNLDQMDEHRRVADD
jgi:hypothetical protein